MYLCILFGLQTTIQTLISYTNVILIKTWTIYDTNANLCENFLCRFKVIIIILKTQ